MFRNHPKHGSFTYANHSIVIISKTLRTRRKCSSVTLIEIKFPKFLEKILFSYAYFSRFHFTGHVHLSHYFIANTFVHLISGFSTLPTMYTGYFKPFSYLTSPLSVENDWKRNIEESYFEPNQGIQGGWDTQTSALTHRFCVNHKP